MFYFSNYILLTKRRSESRTVRKMSPQREATQKRKHNIQNSQFTACALTFFSQSLPGFPSRAQSVTTFLLLAAIPVPFFFLSTGKYRTSLGKDQFFFEEEGAWGWTITKKIPAQQKKCWKKFVQWEP